MDVIIIGGGVIGCAVAYYLRRAGLTATIVEREFVGSQASSAAAGMLAPLAESPDPSPFTRLALAGLRAFNERGAELRAESEIDFEYRHDGVLRVAETEAAAESLRAMIAWQGSSGLDVRWVDAAGLHDLEPMLAPHLLGALYSPDEGHVNPGLLTGALAAAAVRRGARLIEHCEVEGLETQGDRVTAVRHAEGCLSADHVVFAGGAWSGLWKDRLGIELPVFPVRGQMAALDGSTAPLQHIVYSHDGYLVPKANGTIFIGATEEEDAGYHAAVTAGGLRWLLSAAERLVPAITGAAFVRAWAGLRPGSADHLPLLGPLPSLSNVTLATGHFRNGILLSLITGELIARQISTGVTPPELLPFAPERFLSPA